MPARRDADPTVRTYFTYAKAGKFWSRIMAGALIAELVESGAISRDLLRWYQEHPPESERDRKTFAFCYYVSGNTYRRQIALEPRRSKELASAAADDLERARDSYQELATEFDEDPLAGIANPCHGGLIELGVVLGKRKAETALAELARGLTKTLSDPDEWPVGDWLESYGWWCIFGCNIALRHITIQRVLLGHLEQFTATADLVAERLESWALRERVFAMQDTNRKLMHDLTGRTVPVVLDREKLRALVGTMGRFPRFRETGARLLKSAVVRPG